jgi:rhodanese-related sulfurtransferase
MANICKLDPTVERTITFDPSPGGTPEVSPETVRQHHCNLHIVDVRDEHELVSALGHIGGSSWVPLRALARTAEQWSREDAVVLIDRSGRRSGNAARYLRGVGFHRAASMTGGMLAWKDRGYAVTRERDFMTAVGPPPVLRSKGSLGLADLESHLGDPDQIRWTKAATLLLHGTESCVDGRDAHAVIGTPGGDAGELLLGLATTEALTGHPISESELGEIFDDYVDAFGHFYMHTDEHGLLHLAERLQKDPAFAAMKKTLHDMHAVEALLRQPPPSLRGPLLAHLHHAETIGCGHLRLISLHPDEYQVRPELVKAFFHAFFHRLWKGGEELEYVVLHGDHHEGAVVNVLLDEPVHAYSAVPMIVPHIADSEIFVNHPQVAKFIRRQNASFLMAKLQWAKDEQLDEQEFLDHLDQLAGKQLASTVKYLAAELPVFDVRFTGRKLRIQQR